MNRGSWLDRYSAFEWWVIGDDPDKAFLIEANAIGSAPPFLYRSAHASRDQRSVIRRMPLTCRWVIQEQQGKWGVDSGSGSNGLSAEWKVESGSGQ